MSDTSQSSTVKSREADIPKEMKPLTKEDIAIGAIDRGLGYGLAFGAFQGLIEVSVQSAPKGETFLQSLRHVPFFASTKEPFVINGESYNQMLAMGAGLGFIAGAISSTIGAIHHNREIGKATKWTERQNTSPDTAGAGPRK